MNICCYNFVVVVMPFVTDSMILALFSSKAHLFPFFLIPFFYLTGLKKKI